MNSAGVGVPLGMDQGATSSPTRGRDESRVGPVALVTRFAWPSVGGSQEVVRTLANGLVRHVPVRIFAQRIDDTGTGWNSRLDRAKPWQPVRDPESNVMTERLAVRALDTIRLFPVVPHLERLATYSSLLAAHDRRLRRRQEELLGATFARQMKGSAVVHRFGEIRWPQLPLPQRNDWTARSSSHHWPILACGMTIRFPPPLIDEQISLLPQPRPMRRHTRRWGFRATLLLSVRFQQALRSAAEEHDFEKRAISTGPSSSSWGGAFPIRASTNCYGHGQEFRAHTQKQSWPS